MSSLNLISLKYQTGRATAGHIRIQCSDTVALILDMGMKIDVLPNSEDVDVKPSGAGSDMTPAWLNGLIAT